MINFKEAVFKAGVDASRSLTLNLRNMAAEHGWHPDLVKNLHVLFDGSDLKIHYPDSLKNHIHDLEYGTEHTRPTAVLRKFKNESSHVGNTLLSHFDKHMGGKL